MTDINKNQIPYQDLNQVLYTEILTATLYLILT